MRIRMLTHVAGELAPGVPAPGYGDVIDVDQAVADTWADGERAELAGSSSPASADEQIARLHAEAAEWTEAVVAQVQAAAQARIDELEAELAALRAKPGKRS
jgi:hypothetical protein